MKSENAGWSHGITGPDSTTLLLVFYNYESTDSINSLDIKCGIRSGLKDMILAPCAFESNTSCNPRFDPLYISTARHKHTIQHLLSCFPNTHGLAWDSFNHSGRTELLNTMKRTYNADNEARTHPAEREKLPVISSLDAPVSPPRRRSRPEQTSPAIPVSSGRDNTNVNNSQETPPDSKPDSPPNLAAIEAGQIEVTDHLGIFSSRLSQCIRPLPPSEVPRLQIADWTNLYRRNESPHGRHFVIHQHDHPVAGPHYDLRLQFSETSSVSWSVMYGLPGDPNSRRLNRNATETRVHSFWVCCLLQLR